jgi:hypothetical protein
MSEHRTGVSNWTDEEKRLYRMRRRSGLRGQIESTIIQRTGSTLSRRKYSEKRSRLRQQWRVFNRQQRKASARGD